MSSKKYKKTCYNICIFPRSVVALLSVWWRNIFRDWYEISSPSFIKHFNSSRSRCSYFSVLSPDNGDMTRQAAQEFTWNKFNSVSHQTSPAQLVTERLHLHQHEIEPVRVPARGDGQGGGGCLRDQDYGWHRRGRRSPHSWRAETEVPPQPPGREGGGNTTGTVQSSLSASPVSSAASVL